MLAQSITRYLELAPIRLQRHPRKPRVVFLPRYDTRALPGVGFDFLSIGEGRIGYPKYQDVPTFLDGYIRDSPVFRQVEKRSEEVESDE